jgi:hypothetical protein
VEVVFEAHSGPTRNANAQKTLRSVQDGTSAAATASENVPTRFLYVDRLPVDVDGVESPAGHRCPCGDGVVHVAFRLRG